MCEDRRAPARRARLGADGCHLARRLRRALGQGGAALAAAALALEADAVELALGLGLLLVLVRGDRRALLELGRVRRQLERRLELIVERLALGGRGRFATRCRLDCGFLVVRGVAAPAAPATPTSPAPASPAPRAGLVLGTRGLVAEVEQRELERRGARALFGRLVRSLVDDVVQGGRGSRLGLVVGAQGEGVDALLFVRHLVERGARGLRVEGPRPRARAQATATPPAATAAAPAGARLALAVSLEARRFLPGRGRSERDSRLGEARRRAGALARRMQRIAFGAQAHARERETRQHGLGRAIHVAAG